jgi:hypothetical protein
MKEDKDIRQRPEAYPKPTETDRQLKNQDEYIQVQNNREDDQSPLKQDNTSREREGFKEPGKGI